MKKSMTMMLTALLAACLLSVPAMAATSSSLADVSSMPENAASSAASAADTTSGAASLATTPNANPNSIPETGTPSMAIPGLVVLVASGAIGISAIRGKK